MCISNMATRALTAGQMMQAFGQRRTATVGAAAPNTQLGRAIGRSGAPNQRIGGTTTAESVQLSRGQAGTGSGDRRNKSVMY